MPIKPLVQRRAHPLIARVLSLLAVLLSLPALAQQVHFINPGRSDEAFWRMAGEAMQAAADSLGLRFSQEFAERDPERSLALARALAARPAPQRPDYVLLVNEKNTLVANARVLGEAGIRSFAAFSGLLPQERERFAPRSPALPLLLGSLEPRAEDAGYLTAKALIAAGLRGRPRTAAPLQLLAIAGDRSTPVSIARNQGLQRALDEHKGRVLMRAMVAADWRRDLAQQLAARQLAQTPGLQLVWCGSDQMAFGVMDAARALGLQPGRDLHVSGINTSVEAMQALMAGRLSALAGGHFLTGAFALVMLYDHHRGHDFASQGVALEQPLFIPFDAQRAQRYLSRFGAGPMPALDMRSFSKVYRPQQRRYRFTVQPLLLPAPAH